ncbi:hypothetical protein C2G38_2254036 [Gigaspora rosea]|uniref:RNase H type-1 domain-containing protein n=1 Tax=Gigaspora rosea TaxID=44941 RepID=A0A397UCG4_9GLOM|nr:hypothetical protein C2G38_2254036 [Gigaspora rosea]
MWNSLIDKLLLKLLIKIDIITDKTIYAENKFKLDYGSILEIKVLKNGDILLVCQLSIQIYTIDHSEEDFKIKLIYCWCDELEFENIFEVPKFLKHSIINLLTLFKKNSLKSYRHQLLLHLLIKVYTGRSSGVRSEKLSIIKSYGKDIVRLSLKREWYFDQIKLNELPNYCYCLSLSMLKKDLAAILVPTITSLIWLHDKTLSTWITTIAAFLLEIKFLLFFCTLDYFGTYFAIMIGVAQKGFSFLVVLGILVLAFAHSLHLLLRPTSDLSYVSSRVLKNNWTLAFLLVIFSFFTTVYLLNLFISLLGNAIDDRNNEEYFLQLRGEILSEIELFWMLPHQRRKTNWFPEILWYRASVKELKKYIETVEDKKSLDSRILEISETEDSEEKLKKLIDETLTNKINDAKLSRTISTSTLLHPQLYTRNPTSIPILPNLLIPTAQIPSFFHSSPALDTLQSICHYNSHLTELTFYTDGSVIDLGNSQCSMGIGWIQLHNQNILYTFQSQIKFWPCSFKAELVAVLSAISTAPKNCSIQIFTDSQSIISKYSSLIHTMPLSKPFNIPYWPIWNTLLNFIRSYNLNITFHKVIAHQNDEFNNKADQLARCHQTALYLLFDSQNIYNHNFTLSVDNISIELPIHHYDLPALYILHRRNPSYSNTCHLCQQASELLYWIICPTSKPLFQLIKDSLAHILSPNKLEITNLAAENLYTQIMNLNSF